jgi:DNA-binding CsgD family transcriptional regulator
VVCPSCGHDPEFAARCSSSFSATYGITRREREVLDRWMLCRGEIAAELGTSLNTIKTQIRSLTRRLGVKSLREAARLEARHLAKSEELLREHRARPA